MNKKNSFTRLIDSLPWRFFRKLALVHIFVTALVIIATAYISRDYLKTYMSNQAHTQVKQSLSVVKESLESQKLDPLKWCLNLNLQGDTHFTVLNWEGYPLCQDGRIPQEKGNISNFQEIKEARNAPFGMSIRKDQSGTKTLFGATVIEIQETQGNEGAQKYFVHQTFSLNELENAISALDNSILIFLFPLLLLTSIVSLWASLQVSFPLRSILNKVERMKGFSPENSKLSSSLDLTPSSGQEDEWMMVEKTLDKAKVNIEKYINELYNENAKITTLMESISDSILAVDKSGHILFANRHFKKNFLPQGMEQNNLSNLKLWEITRDIDTQNLIKKSFEESQIVKQRSHPLSIKRGKDEAFFDITVSPLLDSHNKTFGVVCVFHDVTERIRADQMREDFVANVSHEVRTPLTALKGYVQMLRNAIDQNPQEAKNYLQTIESNTNRLTELFQDILNLSVIESQQKIKKTFVNTEEITHSVISNVKQSHTQKNLEVELEFPVREVWGDAKLIEQVLTNLIDNAYKYTPEGGKIKVAWQPKKNGTRLEVHDSGKPIPEEHHPRIFERFYRLDNGRSRQAGGTGLGLAIVKHIIQKHGGTIRLSQSDLGGNLFSATFPTKKSPDQKGPSISYI